MNYALLVPHQVIRTISPEQYNRLRAEGHKAQGNQHKKTILTDYATYEAEVKEAREYTHAEYHRNYPKLACYYDGCEKAVKKEA